MGDGVIALRPWRVSDLDRLVEAWADSTMQRYTDVPTEPDAATARRFVEGSDERRRAGVALDLVVTSADDAATLLGEVGMTGYDERRRAATIGWWTAPDARRQGVATRAVGLVATWLLSLDGIDTLIAEIERSNDASRRLAEVNGFRELVRRHEGRAVFVRSVETTASEA